MSAGDGNGRPFRARWEAGLATSEWSRRFVIDATALRRTAYVHVVYDHRTVASFDATLDVTRDRRTGRVVSARVEGGGETSEATTVRRALEQWASAVAYRAIRALPA